VQALKPNGAYLNVHTEYIHNLTVRLNCLFIVIKLSGYRFTTALTQNVKLRNDFLS